MPLVILSIKDVGVFKRGMEEAKKLSEALPRIVASALNTPEVEDGKLTEKDIEVWGRGYHPLDTNTMPVEILIIPGHYPARWENIRERKEGIEEELRAVCPEIKGSGFVWILPQQFNSFGLL